MSSLLPDDDGDDGDTLRPEDYPRLLQAFRSAATPRDALRAYSDLAMYFPFSHSYNPWHPMYDSPTFDHLT